MSLIIRRTLLLLFIIFVIHS